MTNKQVLNRTERRAAVSLAAVFGVRMLGLFLIMPVLAIYARSYPDYAPWLVGLAIGGYGLSQALLQIPLGLLSDRIGRRPVIIGGLLVFAAGSVVAATASSLAWVVVGRVMQGMGAVAAAILALAADVSREEQRPKVMATIGMCIGLAFALALVLGPFLGAKIGLSGLFWLTAASAIVAIVLLLIGVPKIVTHSARREALPVWSEMSSLLRHPQLLRLDFGVLALHCTLTAWFVILPLELVSAGLPEEQHGWLYLPTLFGSFALMVPMLIVAAKKQQQKRFFQLAISLLIAALMISQLFNTHWWALVVGVLIFFVGFNFLEASLPSLLTKLAPPGSKGSASGVYTTSQFLGAFLGGAVGGWLQQHFGPQAVMLFCSGLLLCWLLATIGMRDPAQYRSVSFTTAVNGQQQAEQLAQQLSAIGGVVEARVVVADSATYLKVEKAHYDEPAVQAVLAQFRS